MLGCLVDMMCQVEIALGLLQCCECYLYNSTKKYYVLITDSHTIVFRRVTPLSLVVKL